MAKLELIFYFLAFGGCVVHLEGYVLPKKCITFSSSSDIVTYYSTPEKLCDTNVMRIFVNQPTVTQIRVDFITFTLAQPKQADSLSAFDCVKDKFRAVSESGADLLGFQHLCGENSRQHIYLYVDASEKPRYVDLFFDIGDAPKEDPADPVPAWNLEITQIDCCAIPTKDLCAPPGCLQFYTEPTGEFRSFNYKNGHGSYQGSLNYAICFKNLENMCNITFTAIAFQLPKNDFDKPYGQTGCNVDTDDATNPSSKDYVFIPNAVVGKVKESIFCGDYLSYKQAVSTVPGPKSVHFHSDNVGNIPSNGDELGFVINYQQSIGNCDA